MTQFILTGHGYFAKGLRSCVELIAGAQADFHNVDFPETMSSDELEAHLQGIFDAHEDILVCCDLLGGSPFKAAATLSRFRGDIAIVTGINLPVLLELLFARNQENDPHRLAEIAESVGANSISTYRPLSAKKEVDEEVGI